MKAGAIFYYDMGFPMTKQVSILSLPKFEDFCWPKLRQLDSPGQQQQPPSLRFLSLQLLRCRRTKHRTHLRPPRQGKDLRRCLFSPHIFDCSELRFWGFQLLGLSKLDLFEEHNWGVVFWVAVPDLIKSTFFFLFGDEASIFFGYHAEMGWVRIEVTDAFIGVPNCEPNRSELVKLYIFGSLKEATCHLIKQRRHWKWRNWSRGVVGQASVSPPLFQSHVIETYTVYIYIYYISNLSHLYSWFGNVSGWKDRLVNHLPGDNCRLCAPGAALQESFAALHNEAPRACGNSTAVLQLCFLGGVRHQNRMV